MKNIITSDVLDPNIAQPFTAHSLKFLQDGTKEAVANLVQSALGFAAVVDTPYALWGCIKSDLGGGDFAYTAGAIYFNGEIYDFPAIATIPIATADICTITITNDGTADPVEFTDGISRNVHNHRDLVLSDGTLGTADFDFADVFYLIDPWHYVGTTGEPAFGAGFSNAGGGASDVAFRKTLDGKIELRGLMNATAIGTAFTLPVTHKPISDLILNSIVPLATSEVIQTIVDSASGNVSFINIPTTTLVSLDGVYGNID